MTYAIVETGGKQLRVEPGRFYDIELLHVDPDESYSIDKVLLIHHDDDIQIGQPFVEGATVEGTVMRHFRGRKVIVYKMRPKKKTRKKRGHRQEITRLMINSIKLGDSVLAEAEISEFEEETPNLVSDSLPMVEAEETLEAEAQSVEEVAETVVSEEVESQSVSEVEDATGEDVEESIAEVEPEVEESETEEPVAEVEAEEPEAEDSVTEDSEDAAAETSEEE